MSVIQPFFILQNEAIFIKLRHWQSVRDTGSKQRPRCHRSLSTCTQLAEIPTNARSPPGKRLLLQIIVFLCSGALHLFDEDEVVVLESAFEWPESTWLTLLTESSAGVTSRLLWSDKITHLSTNATIPLIAHHERLVFSGSNWPKMVTPSKTTLTLALRHKHNSVSFSSIRQRDRRIQYLYLIVLFWYASGAYQASLVEPWFVFWRDAVQPKYPWRDQTSLVWRRSVPQR